MTTCGNCPDLEHCGPAMQIFLIGKAFEEAGGKVLSVTVPCPRRGNSPPVATLARPGNAGGCDNTTLAVERQPDAVTSPVTPRQRSSDADAAIADLSRRGLSCRAIADELATMGLDVSYRTIARHLKRAQAK